MIKELLNAGIKNKTTKAELITVLGLSERDLVRQVHNERKAGALILSTTANGGGYYLPANKAEINDYVKSMENRAVNTFIAIRAARAALKENDAQLTVLGFLTENDNQNGGANVN